MPRFHLGHLEVKKWLPHGQPSSKVNFEPCFLASLKWSLWLSGPYKEAPYELIASSFLILPPSKVESMLLEYLFKPCCLTGCSWQTALLLNPAPSLLKWISSDWLSRRSHGFNPLPDQLSG